MDKFLEHAAAVLEIFELVEAGAGGREEHDVAGLRAFKRQRHRTAERSDAFDGYRTAQLFLDFRRRRSNQ